MDDAAEREEGGDPVCWAHLVCPDCGAISSEGHRAGCQLAEQALGLGRAGRSGVAALRAIAFWVRPPPTRRGGHRQTAASTAASGRGIRSGSIASVSRRA